MLTTAQKILVARLVSRALLAWRRLWGLSPIVEVTRLGVRWSLDLREGIDLAIYLLGGFERRTLSSYTRLVRHGNVVLDIGANIGAHTLPLAALVGQKGMVLAFEPTEYAFRKLKANIALNPELAPRLDARQVMLVATERENLPTAIYSSWPLEKAKDLHDEHQGRLMATAGAVKATLDNMVRDAELTRVDFIKLDVDGNEYQVLSGGRDTIQEFRPVIFMELAPYTYRENPAEFDQILRMLWAMGYAITDVTGKSALPRNVQEVRKSIRDGAGINVIATPA